MPEFRQYPQATSLRSTDAFLIDRVNAGTMFIEAQDMEFGAGFDGYDIFALTVNTFSPITFNAVRPFILPINFAGSKFSMEILPYDAFVMDVYKNDTIIGTITYGTTIVTVNVPTETTFNIGDTLRILGPNGSQPMQFMNGGSVFSMTLKGTRI